MKTSDPPWLATLLLRRLAPGNEPLDGDLVEEYARRRSSPWFWWQVAVAIALAGYRDIRTHTVLALRAIVIGWAAMRLAVMLVGAPLIHVMHGWVLDRLIVTLGSHPFVMMWAVDLASLPSTIVIGVISGWTVGRLHRPHVGALLACVLAVFVGDVGRSVLLLLIPRDPGHLSLPYYPLLFVGTYILMPPLCVLLGGICGLRRVVVRQDVVHRLNQAHPAGQRGDDDHIEGAHDD